MISERKTMIELNSVHTYFISDAHLGARNLADNERREKILLNFLEHIKGKGSALFIVGDLFDFWFEYKNVIPKEHFKIIAKLIELKEARTEIFYIAGNHDYWIGDFLNNYIGIRHFKESAEIEISGKKFFIAHGDGLKKNDGGYRFLKKILRNKINIKLYNVIHPDIGIPLAKRVSRTSRKYTSNKHYGSDEDYIDYAGEKFSGGYDYIILAHTHRPLMKSIHHHVLMNLGDWISNFSYGYFDGSNLELKYWDTGDTGN